MTRRRRGVRVLKWVGAGLCVLIAGVFVTTGWFGLAYLNPGRGVWLVSYAGAFAVYYDFEAQFPDPDVVRGFHASTHPFNLSAARWPKLHEKQVLPPRVKSGPGNFSYVRIPLWLPFLALLLPTLLLWFLDRRRALPGHCRCGYNLTGLTSGRCPECGAAAVGAEQRS